MNGSSALRAARLACGLALGAVALAAGAQQPAAYPARAVRLIVPYPPGGSSDTLARLLAAELARTLGQQVVVDNRPGASGAIGVEAAARAAPDGYTLVLINSTQAINPALRRAEAKFDLTRELAPIALVGSAPMIFAVRPSSDLRTVADLVREAKARPGKLSYASCGPGTPQHIAGELFKLEAKVELLHVPYKGCAPAVQDALGGQVDLLIATASGVLPQVNGGRLRPLGVTSPARIGAAPELATVAEQGYRTVVVETWHGLLAPAATPKEIVARLRDESLRIVRQPAAGQRLREAGIEPVFGGDDALADLIRRELARYVQVVQQADIKAE